MPSDSTEDKPLAIQEEQNTAPSIPVSAAPSLSPLVIERICRAFIHLITTEEDAIHATKQQP